MVCAGLCGEPEVVMLCWKEKADSVILEGCRFLEWGEWKSAWGVHLKSRTITVAAGSVVCSVFPSWRFPPWLHTTFFLQVMEVYISFSFSLLLLYCLGSTPWRGKSQNNTVEICNEWLGRRCHCAREGSAYVADGEFCALVELSVQKPDWKSELPSFSCIWLYEVHVCWFLDWIHI